MRLIWNEICDIFCQQATQYNKPERKKPFNVIISVVKLCFSLKNMWYNIARPFDCSKWCLGQNIYKNTKGTLDFECSKIYTKRSAKSNPFP